MRTLFIGDLHLSADRQDILNAFYHFLDTGLEQVDALYILGDLFEVWVSDDLAEPFALALAERLYEVSRSLPVYFIHGNRDFMLGKEYAAKAGMTLLPKCIDWISMATRQCCCMATASALWTRPTSVFGGFAIWHCPAGYTAICRKRPAAILPPSSGKTARCRIS